MRPIAFLAVLLLATLAVVPASAQRSPLPPPGPIEHINGNLYKIFGGGGNTLVFVQEDGVTTNFGAPLPATENHPASDPQATAAPRPPPSAGN
jgi:hypothetical protein